MKNGACPTVAIATRPATHIPTRAINGRPAKPRAPVQLGTAVSMNPEIAATTNP